MDTITGEMFRDKAGAGQKSLRNLLRAYALHNPTLGYCQGMGMVAGTLLMWPCADEEAFWCFVAMLDHYIDGYFDSGLTEIQINSAVLHTLLREHDPHLHALLDENGMIPLLYATDWFMCCFVKTLPWESVLRIWDVFFFEGAKVFFKVALAILYVQP